MGIWIGPDLEICKNDPPRTPMKWKNETTYFPPRHTFTWHFRGGQTKNNETNKHRGKLSSTTRDNLVGKEVWTNPWSLQLVNQDHPKAPLFTVEALDHCWEGEDSLLMLDDMSCWRYWAAAASLGWPHQWPLSRIAGDPDFTWIFWKTKSRIVMASVEVSPLFCCYQLSWTLDMSKDQSLSIQTIC